MKWCGESPHDRDVRERRWHRHFCLFPTQMTNGNWVWLEHCWAQLVWTGSRDFWRHSDSLTCPEEIRTPLPPMPKE